MTCTNDFQTDSNAHTHVHTLTVYMCTHIRTHTLTVYMCTHIRTHTLTVYMCNVKMAVGKAEYYRGGGGNLDVYTLLEFSLSSQFTEELIFLNKQ